MRLHCYAQCPCLAFTSIADSLTDYSVLSIMAAVISETVTDSSRHNMRHNSPSSPSFAHSSRSEVRVPPSPKPEPTSAVPHQTAANTLIPPSSSCSSQAPHAPASSQAAPERLSSSHSSIAIPLSFANTIERSSWSSDDIAKYGGQTIKVRDLAHIQSFVNEEFLARRSASQRAEDVVKYEISGMPITDVIEMVAGLLTKITTTNDGQHKTLHDQMPAHTDTTNLSEVTSSVLAFHGKNVPGITILSYLSRIHKYCPTTYEVFLSLLVYFDRMTDRVNAGQMRDMRRLEQETDDESSYNLSHFFVVDSFNIHRLVIAGVTCASKFFSDVFYTNSRYAKVSSCYRCPNVSWMLLD